MQLNTRGTRSVFFFTFLWIAPFVWKETFKKSSLTQNRLQQLPPQLDAEVLYNRFSSFWEEEHSKRRPKLWFALLRTFLLDFSFVLVTGVLYVMSYFLLVYALIWTINGLEATNLYSTLQLLSISSLLPLCGVVANFFGHTMEYMLNVIGMKYRILLTTAIYKKILLVSYARFNFISSGTIITIITSDLFKFDVLFNTMMYLFICPLGVIFIVIFAYIEIGMSALLIIPISIFHLVTQLGVGYLVSLSYNKSLQYSDVRNKRMREFIAGIQLIKCFAWEYAVVSVITRIRRMEFLMVLINAMLQLQSNPFSIIFSVLFSLTICLSVYVATGGYLTSRLVFGLQALLFIYQRLFVHMTHALNCIGELRVTLKRIEGVLQTPEMELTIGEQIDDIMPQVPLNAIELSGGLKHAHNCNEANTLISNISFWLKRGESMSVVGKVGSGKTSLLLSLINEIDILTGECWLYGDSAFLPHLPWIISTSVRENITYGRKWNKDWYDEVIAMCCLETDIQQFPQGDLTVVGDRGITLSGGQKSRVALARVVYADVDVYLLDDPLSSVDSVVATQLLSIFTTGRLSDRTAVIVTHQLQLIDQTDTVLLLDDRRCIAYGSYSIVKNLAVFEQYREFINTIKDDNVQETNNYCDSVIAHLDAPESQNDPLRVSTAEPSSSSPREQILHFNRISFKTYAIYLWNGGNILCNCSFLVLALCSFFCLIIGKNYYLIWWIMASSARYNTTDKIFQKNTTGNPLLFLPSDVQIIFFIVFCTLTSILLIVTFLLLAWIIIFASYKLHNSMLFHVLRAPMMFFYSTSSGSILNRFSKDIFAMENILPHFYSYSGVRLLARFAY